jgi:hypothetical protein
LGGVFWLLLWGWLLLPREAVKIPTEGNLLTRSQSTMKLQGFRVRQETRYTDGGSTYMDLKAEKGWNLEEAKGEEVKDSHVLVNVEVRLVPKKNPQSATETEGLDSLSARADVAWVLIKAATGIWSIETRNINLMGNVRIYGYSLSGELSEWISAERLFYNQKENTVRSISPAIYEGESFQVGQAVQCFVESKADLTEININILDYLAEDFPTPFRNPGLLPPYIPPEALRFIQESPQTGS